MNNVGSVLDGNEKAVGFACLTGNECAVFLL